MVQVEAHNKNNPNAFVLSKNTDFLNLRKVVVSQLQNGLECCWRYEGGYHFPIVHTMEGF